MENSARFKARSATDYELSGTFLPAQIKQELPETTHPLTLVGQEPFTKGNVFGTHLNNNNLIVKLLNQQPLLQFHL